MVHYVNHSHPNLPLFTLSFILRPSSFIPQGPYTFFSFRPLTIILWGRPVPPFWTVQFHLHISTSLCRLTRPFSDFWTVHFRRPATLSLLNRPLWPNIVHFRLVPYWQYSDSDELVTVTGLSQKFVTHQWQWQTSNSDTLITTKSWQWQSWHKEIVTN